MSTSFRQSGVEVVDDCPAHERTYTSESATENREPGKTRVSALNQDAFFQAPYATWLHRKTCSRCAADQVAERVATNE